MKLLHLLALVIFVNASEPSGSSYPSVAPSSKPSGSSSPSTMPSDMPSFTMKGGMKNKKNKNHKENKKNKENKKGEKGKVVAPKGNKKEKDFSLLAPVIFADGSEPSGSSCPSAAPSSKPSGLSSPSTMPSDMPSFTMNGGMKNKENKKDKENKKYKEKKKGKKGKVVL